MTWTEDKQKSRNIDEFVNFYYLNVDVISWTLEYNASQNGATQNGYFPRPREFL